MNLTITIPYDQLTIRGRYLESEVQTSDKPAVPECYEVDSVRIEGDVPSYKSGPFPAFSWFVELVDILTPESLTELERRKLDEIRASIEHSKAEDAA